jgi:hypothetical protein
MDTGNLGETILATWCHQVDLIPNRVTVDKDGWDFLVALPPSYSSDIKSLDKDDSHDRVLVQVKTTENEKGNRNIKLSNLKKFVDAPIPAFYLLIQVNADGEPIKAHVFHVWKEIISKVQKKIRHLPKENWDQLNKYGLVLPWKIAEEVKKLHGSELKEIILKNLRETKKSYSEKKYSLREKVGYEKETGQIHFQSKLPDKYKDDIEAFMVDLYLGEVDKVEVYDWEVTDKRFGDEIVIDKQEGGHFSLKNIEPEGPATIKFITEDHRSSVEFSTEYYIPRGIGQLVKDESKWKILYKAQFIKFSIYPEGKKIEFLFETPDFSNEVKLSEVIDITNLMLFLGGLESNEKVNFEVKHDGKLFWGGNLNFDQYKEGLSIEYFQSIKSATKLLNHFNLKSDVIVKPTELKSQVGLLNFLYELLAPKPTFIRLEFSAESDLLDYSSTIGLLQYTVVIGDYLLPFQLKAQGQPTISDRVEDDQIFYILKSSDVRIEQYRILSRERDDAKSAHEEMKKQSIEKYDTEDQMVMYFHKEENKD